MRIEVATEYFPRLTTWHVRHALKWINPVDLAGVEFIRLIDEHPAASEVRKKSFDIWNFTYNGQYVKQNRHTATHINLFTRDLYLGFPSLFKVTPATTLGITFTLAHEVGHHVIRHRGYIYEPTEKYKPYGIYDKYEEGMAENYAYEVIRRMSKSWYYRFGQFLSRMLSSICFGQATVDWEKKNYERAAYYSFCAYRTDHNNLDAARMYQKAITMLNDRKCDQPSDSERKASMVRNSAS